MSNSVTTQLEMFQNLAGSFIANANSAGRPWKTGSAESLHMAPIFFPFLFGFHWQAWLDSSDPTHTWTHHVLYSLEN